MKKHFFTLIGVLCTIFAFGQVGVNTETPQRTLHVNGSMQITNELNVGGDGATEGNSGSNQQVLTSQGKGLPPLWRTIDIPIIDGYRLTGVYKTKTNAAELNSNNSSVQLGSIPNIHVSKAQNFLLILTQNNTYIRNITFGISYRFDFRYNASVAEQTSWNVITRQGFSDAQQNNPYQFIITDVPIGENNTLTILGVRQNSTDSSSSGTLYFNKNYTNSNLIDKTGSLVVFVYEMS
ncbi:hypothetical protein E2605_07475 [Dysgonomonas capnocytophagoides]|uniref:Uncharacterized protein n=1 Tax=Dysgonomonas capnocytophagoides TaxID=45254 RepID=A0A4Y8L5C4_9BACT|nr:hypothetical protein [Dysgonomonas capnocytophagoides]TFD97497.1 hypothetical protein E2605_07475 [Dysgonomonas capnocytophagoides]